MVFFRHITQTVRNLEQQFQLGASAAGIKHVQAEIFSAADFTSERNARRDAHGTGADLCGKALELLIGEAACERVHKDDKIHGSLPDDQVFEPFAARLAGGGGWGGCHMSRLFWNRCFLSTFLRCIVKASPIIISLSVILAGCASIDATVNDVVDTASGRIMEVRNKVDETVKPVVDTVNTVNSGIKKAQSGALMFKDGIDTVKKGIGR
jgi:hypothetical protein